ncbi:uncharacterized protein LOC111318286 isoform X1 [Durio zibethinus]|uniref:Uncharacterized protein LOC111318286 isoform X1 n=1 Tax=Durio zibethinus TaxID=66656 RepID=A0A6P6BI49_DURZI|nr:uncharacterized protein LOC111318286 isoform X1 [Durio zibethinus]
MGFRGVLGGGGADNLVRNTAVTANSQKSLWLADSTDDLNHCKRLVSWFEMCARSYKEEGGKENPFCQSFLQDIERDCAKFKPSWSDWWTNDLKKDHCYAIERTYDFCNFLLKGLKEATKEIRDKCNYLSSVETRNLVSKVIYQLDCIKKELISIKDEVKAIKQMLDDSDKRGKEMKKN